MTTSSPLTSTRDRAQQANLSLAWKEGTWYCVNDTAHGSHALYFLCEDHKSTDEFHAIWKEAKGCSRKMRRSDGTVVRLHKARGNESLGNARYKWYAFVRKPLHDVYTGTQTKIDILNSINLFLFLPRFTDKIRFLLLYTIKTEKNNSTILTIFLLLLHTVVVAVVTSSPLLLLLFPPVQLLPALSTNPAHLFFFCRLGKIKVGANRGYLAPIHESRINSLPSYHFSFFIFFPPVTGFFVSRDEDFVAPSPSNKYVLKKKRISWGGQRSGHECPGVATL